MIFDPLQLQLELLTLTLIMNCLICDEKYNNAKHTLVSCPYCAFGACRECCKTYLVDQLVPKCMGTNCGKEWTRQFLNASFPKSFLQKEWRNSREKIAFDRETAQLPATQEYISHEKVLDGYRSELRAVAIEMSRLEDQYTRVYNIEKKVFENRRFAREADNVPEPYRVLRARRDTLRHMLFQGHNKPTSSANHFVRACPSEECRGFLGSDWKCGMCNLETCKKCHVIKSDDTEHTCNPDDVETAKLLAKDTKPCPKCHTGITKIDGCDQMWCTQCHTAFSWRTGEVETKIHNPHYYEWQRKMNNGVAPRVEGDRPPCQARDVELPHTMYRYILVSSNNQFDFKTLRKIECLIRKTIHLREADLREYRPTLGVDATEARDLRVRYLEKSIDKTGFIRTVLRRAKKAEIHTEIRNILTMFIQVVTDLVYAFHRVCHRENAIEPLRTMFREIETLREYVNEQLKEIFTAFKYKMKYIEPMFDRSPEFSTDPHLDKSAGFIYKGVFVAVK